MKKVMAVGMAAVLLCFSQTGCSGDAVINDVIDQAANVIQAEDENVLAVKGGEPLAYPGKTYGEAFENFFSSPTWKYFVGTQEGPDEDGDGKPDYTEENVDVVEFTGYCTYRDADVKVLIQFALDKENDTFDAVYMSINDVPQNNFTLWSLIETVFTDGDTAADSENVQGQDLEEGGFSFADLSGYSFNFSSGAGAWGTGLEINADGSFTGGYHDSNMGDTGAGYPNGSTAVCNFNGQFTQLKKVNEYTYSMKLERLEYDNAAGIEEIIDGVKFIYSDAYGVEGGGEFLIYLPGAPVSELPEEFIWWVQYDISEASELPSYALYNVAGQYGFYGYGKEGSGSDAGQTPQEAAPEGNYTDYSAWCGEYDNNAPDYAYATILEFVLYSDGSQNPECGYITTSFRGIETKGNLYYLGGSEFMWEEESGSGNIVYFVDAVENDGTYQLDMYDSDGEHYMTYTMYRKAVPW